ncbi:MAG: ComF family protein [Anaerolineae bacterium]|nr:ComF family protein [Anaerolineae bacterium]
MSPRQGWREAKDSLLDFLFPPRCAGCGRLGSWLCPACISEIEFIEPPLCSRCGLPSVENPCLSCRIEPLAIDGIRGVGYLRGPLKRAIYQFKYRQKRKMALPLAGLMYQYLLENPLPAELIVPVPLHMDRLRERGYNQAALLARELSERRGLPVEEKSVVRIKETTPQVALKPDERRKNVRGAFRGQGERLKDRQVLLIDDVSTTGATLDACAEALRERGARSVWALVLARET